jgi:hypothetical protein
MPEPHDGFSTKVKVFAAKEFAYNALVTMLVELNTVKLYVYGEVPPDVKALKRTELPVIFSVRIGVASIAL